MQRLESRPVYRRPSLHQASDFSPLVSSNVTLSNIVSRRRPDSLPSASCLEKSQEFAGDQRLNDVRCIFAQIRVAGDQ